MTTVAFATGVDEGGWDYHHRLWMSHLGLAVQDAAVGTPWPTIIFDAKNRALAQHPFLEPYLRRVVSMGTMVKKLPAPAVTDVGDDELTEDVIVFGVSSLANANAQPVLEYRLPASAHTTLAIYDVRGRLVTKLAARPTDRGRHRFTWDGRDDTGRRANSGIYFARLFTDRFGAASTKIVLVR